MKSSNFCALLKPSFVWFTTEHGESGESKAVTSLRERKLRLSQSDLLLCLSIEAFLPHKFVAGAPQSISSTSSDSEMSFDSEDSEIYYITEENGNSHSSTSQREYLEGMSTIVEPVVAHDEKSKFFIFVSEMVSLETWWDFFP